MVLKNLSETFPDKSREEILHIALKVFENHAKFSLEVFLLPLLKKDRILQTRTIVEGKEHIAKALEKGKGVAVLTIHFGALYLGGSILDRTCDIIMNDVTQDLSKLDLAFIQRKILLKRLDQYHQAIRGSMFSKGNLLRAMVKSLDRNEGVSLFFDAKHSIKEVMVDFLGQPTFVQPGAVTLGLSRGCAVVPIIPLRTDDNKWKIVIHPPLELEKTGNKEHDLKINVQKCAVIFEEAIKTWPEQWLLWRELHLRRVAYHNQQQKTTF